MAVVKDFLGSRILLDDRVAYPTRKGTEMKMHLAIVEKIEKDGRVQVRTESGRLAYPNPGRMVRLEDWT